jgi:hypothetical protein
MQRVGAAAATHKRVRGMLLVAAGSLCAWNSARAQSGDDSSRQALTVSLGMITETRRDAAASPLAYSGSGPGAQIGYDWSHRGRLVYVSVEAGSSALTPFESSQEFGPSESFSTFALATGVSWRLRGGTPRSGEFALGAELGVSATLARHQYTGPQGTVQDYVLGVVTVAPTARWTRRVGAGQVAASLGVPLLAWVDQPFADVRYARQLLNLRFAPLSQFHEGDGELSYAFRPESRLGFTAGYRIGIFELNNAEPVRRVSQSFSIAVVRRFGVAR